LQRLCNDPQKDAQHHAQHRAISLHEVTQSLKNSRGVFETVSGGAIFT
jgi:hypothetical protein